MIEASGGQTPGFQALIAARNAAEARLNIVDPNDVLAFDAAALELTAAELRVRGYLVDQREVDR